MATTQKGGIILQNEEVKLDVDSKWILKEYTIPFVIILAITAAGIAVFMFVIGLGDTIAPVNQVFDEMTKPTVGRLIYVITSLVAFFVCAIIAARCAAKEKIYWAFYLGFLAGMLLWQAIGEGAWHFGYLVDGNYVNFFCMESSGALFLVIPFAVLTAYLMKSRVLNYGVLCTILSFLCNWYGHFILEGTYPYVSGYFSVSTWYMICGLTVGTAITAAAMLLPILKFKDTKGRLLCSMLLYIGISVIAFGFIE